MKGTAKQGLGAPAGADSEPADWLRARRPEHKQERRDSILAAARRLLDADGVEGATLSAIAREAGLSKANCYRYFESREAILLVVILDEVRAWAAEIDARLEVLPPHKDVDGVVEVFVQTTLERPRLCMLLSCLWSVLERNVGIESIADFKRSFIDVLDASVDSVEDGRRGGPRGDSSPLPDSTRSRGRPAPERRVATEPRGGGGLAPAPN